MPNAHSRVCSVGPIRVGPGQPLAIIAGPCVLESLELGLAIAAKLKDACSKLGLSYVFKASFDKANRSSIDSPRGPGLERGVEWIAHIGKALNIPTTSDIHEPGHAEHVAKHIDLIQIPAFLCRQTDLLVAAGRAACAHNRAVNVKKGQFLSPQEMAGPVKKLVQAGCANVMLTERGTFFGYNRLVNDFLGVADLMELPVMNGDGAAPLPAPVCFDCTHSTQRPGAGEGGGSQGEIVSGGNWRRAPMLARAATAAGVHALFMETHPNPPEAMSDAATMIPLKDVEGVLKSVAAVCAAVRLG